jgi:TPR repeat protein/serine/threonine protein kinase
LESKTKYQIHKSLIFNYLQIMTFEQFIQRYQWDSENPEHLLGEGGFGTVHKAYDIVESRYVAVKVSEVNRQRESLSLKHEVELVQQKLPHLHKNIAKYELCYRLQMGFKWYDFAILRYYSDGNLQQLVSKYALSEEQKASIARQILEGILFYQVSGIIHRDLKPSNILMAREPNGTYVPKIGDFGISKAFEPDEQTRMTNTVKGGTLRFAAPEQIAGDKIGLNADLWSYGVLLYWLFLGETPVETATGNTSYEQQLIQYLNLLQSWTLSDKVQQIPQPFQTWVQRCLVVDPRLRVKSPEALLQVGSAPIISEGVVKPEAIVSEETIVSMEETRTIDEKSIVEEKRIEKEAENNGVKAETSKIHSNSLKRYMLLVTTVVCGVIGLIWMQYTSPEAALRRATQYYNDGNYNAAFPIFFKYQEHKLFDAAAQYRIGYMYSLGKGVVQNDVEAVKWYRKLAEQGDSDGQNSLGKKYENGQGVTQDYAEAVKWYRKSAEQGNSNGQNSLGWMYAHGKGVKQDDGEALKWCRKSAEQGNPYGQNSLGDMYTYTYGHNIKEDYTEALKWYRKSVEQGNSEGQRKLGIMYDYGRGVKQDYTESLNWYRKSAEQGNVGAQYHLGYIYEYGGCGVPKNKEIAISWFEKAAAQGNEQAKRVLSRLEKEAVPASATEAKGATPPAVDTPMYYRRAKPAAPAKK